MNKQELETVSKVIAQTIENRIKTTNQTDIETFAKVGCLIEAAWPIHRYITGKQLQSDNVVDVLMAQIIARELSLFIPKIHDTIASEVIEYLNNQNK